MQTRNTQSVEPDLIQWGGDDAFTHSLIVGPTRCGKTATILKPMIHRILMQKKKGIPVGLSVIEPKGDVARMVKKMAEEMGLQDELVYIDPLFPEESNRINVMKGDKNDVAEATVAVLKSLFGKQEIFFATVQESSARKITMMLKILKGDNIDITHLLENLRDETILARNVQALRSIPGHEDLVEFFDKELLGSGQMAEKYRQLIIGLRAQLENITSNEVLREIITGRSDIDLNEHFEKGGILAVNSALGLLGGAGDAFGTFIAMHLQLATFRRPGTEKTRIPHYLIIDEFSRYINPDIERFLSIAAEYRVALIAAIQSLGQLELESGKMSGRAIKRAILTSTRNKIVFGGFEYEDAFELSKMMGTDNVKKRSKMYNGGFMEQLFPKVYQDVEEEVARFDSTFFMTGLERFHFVHKLLIDGTPQESGVGVGQFVPYDWVQKMKEENENKKLIKEKPPIWNWKAHAIYKVEEYRKAEKEKLQKKQEEVFSVTPFSDERTEAVDPTLMTFSFDDMRSASPSNLPVLIEETAPQHKAEPFMPPPYAAEKIISETEETNALPVIPEPLGSPELPSLPPFDDVGTDESGKELPQAPTGFSINLGMATPDHNENIEFEQIASGDWLEDEKENEMPEPVKQVEEGSQPVLQQLAPPIPVPQGTKSTDKAKSNTNSTSFW